jgi:hypothetical protein
MKRFIHIPKNGGSAVTNWLHTNNLEFVCGKPDKGVGKHRIASNWKDEPTEKFCVVRNPYTRVISYYNYLTPVEQWDLSFNDYVRQKQSPIKFKIPNGWDLQTKWIDDFNGLQLVDKILRYESLEKELQEYFQCWNPVGQVNNSTKTTLNLTDELKDIIYDHFESDFKRFGYSRTFDIVLPSLPEPKYQTLHD